MNIAELSRIDRSIDIAAPPERVYRALTDPAELAAWFKVSIAGLIAAGQEVWMTVRHAPYEGQRFRVIVLELTPARRVVWRWHPGEMDPNVDYSAEPMTTVTFTLEPTRVSSPSDTTSITFGMKSSGAT